MFTRTISAFAAAGLTIATVALATPLHAAPIEEQVVEVKISDLDLSTDRDAARLERRLRAAARQICGWIPANDLNMQRQVVDCQEGVVANAQAGVELALAEARPQQSLALRAR